MISISDRIRDWKSCLKFVVAATGVLFLLSVKQLIFELIIALAKLSNLIGHQR